MLAPKLLLAVAASATVLSTAMAAPQAVSSLGLGQPCASSAQCANGAACYAANSMQVPSCGNSHAACTLDSHCAFNTCVEGFCKGSLSSSIIASTTLTTSAPTSTGPGTGPGTVDLGKACSLSVPNQCANGATCFAVNPMLAPLCGNFQAPCASDSQCAFDTCVRGICSGFPSQPPTAVPHTSLSSAGGPPPRPSAGASGVSGAPVGASAGASVGASSGAPSGASMSVGTVLSSAQMRNNTMATSAATGGQLSSSVSWLGGPQHRTPTAPPTTKHLPTPSATPTPTKKKSDAGRVGAEVGALLAVAAFVAIAM